MKREVKRIVSRNYPTAEHQFETILLNKIKKNQKKIEYKQQQTVGLSKQGSATATKCGRKKEANRSL